MSLLTGPEIHRHVKSGTIVIDPFDERHLNPNSYDLALDTHIKIYDKAMPLHLYWDWLYKTHAEELERNGVIDFDCRDMKAPPIIQALDMKVEEKTVDIFIPANGMVIYPGLVYLAASVECAGSDIFIPCVEGRSSIGRLALFSHTSAGFGDLGFSGLGRPAQWTLELVAAQPVKIYAGVRICQVIFTTPEHDLALGPLPHYTGKYAGQRGPKPSGIWRDFVTNKVPDL